jgi:hypothetical protein
MRDDVDGDVESNLRRREAVHHGELRVGIHDSHGTLLRSLALHHLRTQDVLDRGRGSNQPSI